MTWHRVKVGDLCRVGRGSSPRPINDSRFFEDGDIPWVKVADATASGKYLYETKEHVNKFGASFSRLLRAGSLIICTSGTLGYPIFLGVDGCIHDGWLYTFNYNGLDPHFFYYFLKVNSDYFYSVAYGAAIQNINTEILRNTPISLPPLENQRRIAAILSAYDDLIENNRRRIQLLEQAGRLIYREWFVRLRFPGHERVRVVDGVPEGWEKTRLGRVAAVNQEQLKSSHRGVIEYVDISSVSPGSIDATQSFEFEMAPGRARRIVRHGDIIWSCVRPNRRSHAIIWNPPPNLIASTGFAVITPRQVPTSYLYYALTTDSFVGYLTNRARGGAYPAVLASDFEDAELLRPDKTLVGEFDRLVCPMIDQRANLRLQNEHLGQARDLLLPKLMSGEIEV